MTIFYTVAECVFWRTANKETSVNALMKTRSDPATLTVTRFGMFFRIHWLGLSLNRWGLGFQHLFLWLKSEKNLKWHFSFCMKSAAFSLHRTRPFTICESQVNRWLEHHIFLRKNEDSFHPFFELYASSRSNRFETNRDFHVSYDLKNQGSQNWDPKNDF